MDRFQSTVEVDAPASICYEKWHHFEQFPHFMKNVKSVSPVGGNRWHWVVTGPLGKELEWDAEIDGDEPSRVISWHTVSEPDVGVQGAVRFDEIGANKTQVTCTIQYEPPAGPLGELVAHVFSNPQSMVEEDLANFKHLVEGTNVPSERAQAGKVMQPDPFVVPGAAAGAAGAASASAGVTPGEVQDKPSSGLYDQEDDYEAVYGLEDELPIVSSSADMDESDIREIETLREEESPYLGMAGAVYSEDLIEMRADEPGLDEQDIYTESMDVYEEDLESFYEDLDEEIDESLSPRESIENYQPADSDSGSAVNPSRPTETGPY
jgi:hypothetical protein